MDEQNNFNNEQNDIFSAQIDEEAKSEMLEQSCEQSVEEAVQENTEQAFAPNDGELRCEGAQQTPVWYGVSYQGNGAFPYVFEPPVPEKKKSRFRKVALVALALAACMVLSVFAGGLGSYLLWGGNDTGFGGGGSNAGMPNTPNSESTNGLGGSVDGPTYEYTDVAFNYATAFAQIQKNNGAGLVGSSNGSAGSGAKSMIDAIAAVKDSVVEITTTVESNRGTMSAGAGSGVIIHADGIVVTNNHVIADCDNIYVRLTNGDTYEAVLRGTDEDGDIAILKITPQEGKPLTVAKLGSSSALVLGEEVFAIGNPLGELGGTVTNGIISATAREINVDGVEMTLLQTNAAINSGNSGGGLFNLAGELIGVVNAKYSATGVEGLGFAIPIDSAYEDSIKDLMEFGYIRGIPVLGITLVEKTSAWGSVIYAAYVYDANDVPGFRDGDYIYSIDGTVVYSIGTSALSAIKSITRAHEIGDELSVVVLRANGNKTEQVSISVTLQE